MTGEEIRIMLEEAVSDLCPNQTCYAEGFLHLSGIKMTVLVTDDNAGNRIQKVETLCSIDDDENYCNLEPNKVYNVSLCSFLAGNVHRRKTNLSKFVRDRQIGIPDHVCLKNYIEEKEIVNPKIEGRIVIDYQDTSTTSTTTSSTTTTSTSSFAIKYSNCILTYIIIFNSIFFLFQQYVSQIM